MPYVWKNSEARDVLLSDLRDGVLPLNAEELSARQAWDLVYSHLVEFHGVEFPQFRDRLRDHRHQVVRELGNTRWTVDALAHDRQRHPRASHNARGEPVFYLHTAARQYLEADIKAKKHQRMKPAALRRTRAEYMVFRLDIFRQRIYQEVRRQKFIFWLQIKRATEERKKRERRRH